MATWVTGPKTSDETFPSNAYAACHMENGIVAYVARGTVHGQSVNGYTTEGALKATLPYVNSAHIVKDYEMLVTGDPDEFCWEKVTDRKTIPEKAVEGGEDGDTKTYIGRSCTPYKDAAYKNKIVGLPGAPRYIPIQHFLGKIVPKWGRLYFTYQGIEYSFCEYEFLCKK